MACVKSHTEQHKNIETQQTFIINFFEQNKIKTKEFEHMHLTHFKQPHSAIHQACGLFFY